MSVALVVDDDPSIRTMLSRALLTLGGEVDQAGGGAEALKMLSAKKYDLVLLDLHMSGIGGLQVLKTVTSQDGPNRDARFCVITADGSEKMRTESLQGHAMMFITKPVHIATLLGLVSPVLKRADMRKSMLPGVTTPTTAPGANSSASTASSGTTRPGAIGSPKPKTR